MTRITKFLLLLCACMLIVTNIRAWENFRFAQLTDIHIGDKRTVEWLKASIKQINEDSTLDFVLVTGDLTNFGDDASLISVNKTLKLLQKPYYVVSGNHESTWTESGMETFASLFHQDRISFVHKGFQFLGFPTGPFIHMAYGHVQPQDLTWLGNEVRTKGQGQRLIVVTHYPLKNGDVDNWYQATDSIRKYGTICCIGGHYHTNHAYFYDGIPGFLGRSNLKDNKGNIGYTEYQITQDSLLVYEHNVGQNPTEWGGISLKKQYYDPQGKADTYPDFSVNTKYGNAKEVWRKNSGVGLYGSPVVDGKVCYVGDNLGKLTCYNLKDGKVLWTCTESGKIVGTPAVAKGIVMFGSTDHNIYGVNAKTGKQIWKIETEKAVMGAVAVKGNTAYIGGSDHKMRAVNINTGTVIWAYGGLEGYVITRPLVTDGKVIFGAWDNKVYALKESDGTLLWIWENMKGHLHYSAAGVWPIATKKAVFLVDPGRAMTALDLKTGKQLWRTKQSKVRESLGISKDGRRLYAKTMEDSIVCYATDASKPVELWACNAGFGYEHATTMLPEQNGIVYSSTKDGLIVAIEGKTGKLLWEHKVGNSFINTVAPAEKGRVLMTETTGEIVLLEYRTPK